MSTTAPVLASRKGGFGTLHGLRRALADGDRLRAADIAIACGAPARSVLPDDMRPGFDAAIAAFAAYETGNDTAAREQLSAIGLSSPFLDWKLLIRGLMAYAAGDESRAVENWMRLREGGMAAQLAAPLRAALDVNFRALQPPRRQQQWSAAADRLRGGLLAELRRLQRFAAQPNQLTQFFGQVAVLLPRLQQQCPELIPLVGQSFYAAAAGGHPNGPRLFKSLFDGPDHDPALDRLQALGAERRRDWPTANRAWKRYAEFIARRNLFSPADTARAQALIWHRAGENALHWVADNPRLRPLKPDAESCFRESVALDPSFADAYLELFQLYRRSNRLPQAYAVGKPLIELRPADASTLRQLAEISLSLGRLNSAIDYYRQAQQNDPFDRNLSEEMSDAYRMRARRRALADDRAGAEDDIRAAIQSEPPTIGLLCQWAATAYRAGDDHRGNELASQARAINPAAAAFSLAAEAVRLKLPRPLRTEFDKTLRDLFAGQVDFASAIALADIACEQTLAPPEYYGWKGHAAKLRALIERSLPGMTSAVAAESLCAFLEVLGWTRLLRTAARAAADRFPSKASFPYYEAQSFLLEKGDRGTIRSEELLHRARRLAEADKSPDARSSELLARIDEAEKKISPQGFDLENFFELFDV